MEPIIANALGQLANHLIGITINEIQKNPQAAMQGLADLISCRHTTADCIQDIWDAVAAGNLSPSAALTATQALAADMERRNQKPAAPPTPTYADALDVIRQSLEYRAIK
jgi:hypothetical protein